MAAARPRQLRRYGCANYLLNNKQIEETCSLTAESRQLLDQAMKRLNLSARAFHRILKVARTIADLAGADVIESAHLSEAIQYRALDRHLS